MGDGGAVSMASDIPIEDSLWMGEIGYSPVRPSDAVTEFPRWGAAAAPKLGGAWEGAELAGNIIYRGDGREAPHPLRPQKFGCRRSSTLPKFFGSAEIVPLCKFPHSAGFMSLMLAHHLALLLSILLPATLELQRPLLTVM